MKKNTELSKNLLDALLYIYEVTREGKIVDDGVSKVLKTFGVNYLVAGITKVLTEEKFIEIEKSKRYPKIKWISSVHPNLQMSNKILEKARAIHCVYNNRRNKTEHVKDPKLNFALDVQKVKKFIGKTASTERPVFPADRKERTIIGQSSTNETSLYKVLFEEKKILIESKDKFLKEIEKIENKIKAINILIKE